MAHARSFTAGHCSASCRCAIRTRACGRAYQLLLGQLHARAGVGVSQVRRLLRVVKKGCGLLRHLAAGDAHGEGRAAAQLADGVGGLLGDDGEVDAPFLYADLEMMWRTVRAAGPVQAAIRRAGERPVKGAVVHAGEPFQSGTGEIRLNNRFRFLTARKMSKT